MRRLAVATPILGASPRKGRGRGGPRALRPAGSTPPRPGSLHSRWPVQCQPRACNARASRHWFLKGDKVFSVRLRGTFSVATRRRSTSSSPRATSHRSRRLDRFRKPLRRLPFLRRLCRGGAVHCSNLGRPCSPFGWGVFLLEAPYTVTNLVYVGHVLYSLHTHAYLIVPGAPLTVSDCCQRAVAAHSPSVL